MQCTLTSSRFKTVLYLRWRIEWLIQKSYDSLWVNIHVGRFLFFVLKLCVCGQREVDVCDHESMEDGNNIKLQFVTNDDNSCFAFGRLIFPAVCTVLRSDKQYTSPFHLSKTRRKKYIEWYKNVVATPCYVLANASGQFRSFTERLPIETGLKWVPVAPKTPGQRDLYQNGTALSSILSRRLERAHLVRVPSEKTLAVFVWTWKLQPDAMQHLRGGARETLPTGCRWTRWRVRWGSQLNEVSNCCVFQLSNKT